MNESIKFIHHFNYEKDSLITYLITMTIEVTPDKTISTYEYVTPSTYPNSKEKKVEEKSDTYSKINEIDLSNLKDNYKRNDLAEYWELYINGRKIIGSYFAIPEEIDKIMSYINLDDKLQYDLGE